MMEISPEVRQAVLDEACARDGHTFTHAVTFASGDPTDIMCPRCERSWRVVESGMVIDGEYVAYDDEAEAIIAERDRLRAVVDAAREFDAAWSAWQAKIELGEDVSFLDDESRRRAASIAALLGAVRQLDVRAEATDG